MKTLSFYLAKVKSKILRNHQPMIEYYRKKGIVIGERCLICSNIVTKESCLIQIGDDVTISTNVSFITHDYSAHNVIKTKADLYGKIIIGNNCFIGERSILLYGVTLADNILVAAGSVVTKSFIESNIIIGGNPAKKIGTWEKYIEKYEKYAQNGFEKKYRNRSLQQGSFLVRK